MNYHNLQNTLCKTITKQKYVVIRIMKQFHVFRNSSIVIKAQSHKSLFNELIKFCLEDKVKESVSINFEQQMMTLCL